MGGVSFMALVYSGFTLAYWTSCSSLFETMACGVDVLGVEGINFK